MTSIFRRMWEKTLPWWLHGDVAYSLGLMVDLWLERMRLSRMSHCPTYAPSDALEHMSHDRRIVRGRDESTASFGNRLTMWLDSHKIRGSPWGMLGQLHAYLGGTCAVRTVDMKGNWFTIEADGTHVVNRSLGNWDWDGAPASYWSRFCVVIESTSGPFYASDEIGSPSLWGGAIGTAGYTIGTTATPEEVGTMSEIVQDWKPAGTTCLSLIVQVMSDNVFEPTLSSGPVGLWGTEIKDVGGTAVESRSTAGRNLSHTTDLFS